MIKIPGKNCNILKLLDYLEKLSTLVLGILDRALGQSQPDDGVRALLHGPELVLHLVVEVGHRTADRWSIGPTCDKIPKGSFQLKVTLLL